MTDFNQVVLILSGFVFLLSILWSIRQGIEFNNLKNNEINSRRLMIASFNLSCDWKNLNYLEYQEWEKKNGFTPLGIHQKFFVDRVPTHNIDVLEMIPEDKWGKVLKEEYIKLLLDIK